MKRKFVKIIFAVGLLSSISVMANSFDPEKSNVSETTTLTSTSKKFVKTKSSCNNSNCSCPGYWGYLHENGHYEGACSNKDGHGHTCGHSPEKHGLKKW